MTRPEANRSGPVNGGVIINDAGKHDVNGISESAHLSAFFLRDGAAVRSTASPRHVIGRELSSLTPSPATEFRGWMETEN